MPFESLNKIKCCLLLQLFNIFKVLPNTVNEREKYTDWLAKYKMSLFADVTVICVELKEHISKLAGQKINTQSVTPIYY